MKLSPSFLFLLLISFSSVQAATYIPDANFRQWLSSNYPSAMSGNYLDESHPDVFNAMYVDVGFQNISDLSGIEAFVNLQTLNCNNNNLSGGFYGATNMPNLTTLWCSFNQLTSVGIPYNIQSFNCGDNQITSLDFTGLGGSLITLVCRNNPLTSINGLVTNPLNSLYATNCDLTQIPEVSANLTPWEMDLSNNFISTVDHLPAYIVNLSNNMIVGIPALNEVLTKTFLLDLSFNPLTAGIDHFNSELEQLTITDTQLPCLPHLPIALTSLICTGNSFSCLPNIPPDLNTTSAQLGFPVAVCAISDPCYVAPPSVQVRMMLDGPYNDVTGMMDDGLRSAGLIPTTEPYTALGYVYAGTNGAGTSVPAGLFSTTGPNAIVDWVIVELRDGNSQNTNSLYALPCLLQRDGDVVDVTGSDVLVFTDAPWDDYFIGIRHRNHLGLVPLQTTYLSDVVVMRDFTHYNLTGCFPNAALLDFSSSTGAQRLWCGDVNTDKTVRYTGTGNDRDPILQVVGGVTPTNTVTGYSNADVNMDGSVIYTGTNNDRDRILETIGGVIPTATRIQVPQF